MLDAAYEKENLELFLETAILVLEEGIAAFQYADDSDGDIGQIIDRTMLLIKEKVESLADAGQSEHVALFDRLIQVNQRNIFDGWSDFQMAWLHLCAEFGDIPELRGRLRRVVELEMKSLQDQADSNYTQEALLGILYRLIVEHREGEQKDKEYPGLVSKWKLAKYKAFKGLHRVEEQRQLAR